jgi:small subunit ribosomal protein S2
MEKTNVGSAAAGQKKPAQSQTLDHFADFDFGKLEINVEAMFKSGVHFGHHKSRRNPKMDEYIFTTKNGVNILNLEKTAEKLKEAMDFIAQTVAEGKDVLFVGTKKQAKRIVESAAQRAEMPYVTERWLGGTFTNFPIISERTRYLRQGLEKMAKGEYVKYTKFEQMKFKEELERLERKMGGIKNMEKLPGAVFVTSTLEDNLAIKEAAVKDIPVIALVDTNSNPEGVSYPIPANEDAVSSLKLILGHMVKAVLEGKAKKTATVKPEAKEEVKAENKKN